MKRSLFLPVIVFVLCCFLCLVFPASAQEYKPGLSFSTVLEGIKYHDNLKRLQIRRLTATFLEPETPGYAILREAGGRDLVRFDFKIHGLKAPYSFVDFQKGTDLVTGGPALTSTICSLEKPGSYVLDFYTGNGKFYSFSFKLVSGGAGSNPFEQGTASHLAGDWNDWGYFYYHMADPQKSVQWKMWLIQPDYKPGKRAKVSLTVTRDSDGQLVAVSRPDVSYDIKPEWVRFEFDLINPPGRGPAGSYLKAGDLLAQDGNYTLKAVIDGKPYGEWKYKVSSGKFITTGRADRRTADPLTFIEGGLDAFWFKKI